MEEILLTDVRWRIFQVQADMDRCDEHLSIFLSKGRMELVMIMERVRSKLKWDLQVLRQMAVSLAA